MCTSTSRRPASAPRRKPPRRRRRTSASTEPLRCRGASTGAVIFGVRLGSPLAVTGSGASGSGSGSGCRRSLRLRTVGHARVLGDGGRGRGGVLHGYRCRCRLGSRRGLRPGGGSGDGRSLRVGREVDGRRGFVHRVAGVGGRGVGAGGPGGRPCGLLVGRLRGRRDQQLHGRLGGPSCATSGPRRCRRRQTAAAVPRCPQGPGGPGTWRARELSSPLPAGSSACRSASVPSSVRARRVR
ncbi:hypothetical protein SHIRM173S_02963 [Streptomyces hirsutus]